MFDRNLPEASLESWVLTAGPTTQGTIFEASNRYFTSKRNAPDMEPVPISLLIDPRGILEALKKGDLLHGEENQVHYYQVHENASQGRKRYERHTAHVQTTLLTKKKCGRGKPPNFPLWRYRRGAGILHRSTSERQQTQDDCRATVHRATGCLFQSGKNGCCHGHSPVVLTHERCRKH